MGAVAAIAGGRVHVVAGSDDLRVKEAALALCRKLAPEGEWGLEVVDGWVEGPEQVVTAVRKVIEAIETPPFLAGEKLVWFKNLSLGLRDEDESDDEEGGADEKEKGARRAAPEIEALEALVAVIGRGLAPNVRLLVSAPGLDRRRAFFKALQSMAQVDTFDLPVTTGRKGGDTLGAMAAAAFKDAGKPAEPAAIARLATLCGPDPRQLRVEAEKAALFAGDAPKVTAAHVDEIVTPAREESHWGWCDAVVEGDAAQAIRLLRQLEFQQENPVGLVAALASHARLLVRCRMLMDCGWLTVRGYNASWAPDAEEILSKASKGRMPAPFRIARVAGQAQQHPRAHWLAFLDLVYEAYAAMFSSGLGNFRALEMLAIKAAELRVA